MPAERMQKEYKMVRDKAVVQRTEEFKRERNTL